jgi:N-acetylglucosamine malate deacetylase 1
MRSLVSPGGRVLAFGAHPDDLEVGAGGLIARLVAEGASVTMVVSSIPNRYPERLAEARAGASLLGARLVLVRDAATSRLEDLAMHELVATYDRLIDEVQPELVLTHQVSDLHWDHFLVHRATISALRRAACDLFAYEASPALGAHARTVGPCFVDISSVIDTKLAAIAAHATQFSRAAVESRRDVARATGRLCGASYAEAYDVLRLRF